MVSYLVVDGICNVEAYPRIGGSCALPDDISWPKDNKDRPCTFLLGAESSWISKNAGVNLPNDLILSIFVPFDPSSVDHALAMARTPMSAKALLHPKATAFRQESSFSLDPPRALIVDLEPDAEDEDEFSSEIEPKIGGMPTWLQRRIEIPQRRFVLQLMSHQIREHWPAHGSLFMGGVGYLFLDIAWNGANPEVGELRLQYT